MPYQEVVTSNIPQRPITTTILHIYVANGANMLELNPTARRIQQSEIRVMSVECEKVRGINLAQGICDTDVPAPVLRAAEAAMAAGRNQYVRLDGIAELRRAIAKKLKHYNGIDADPDSEVIVTNGSTG